MSSKSKYSQNYIQKEVIDYLEKDGALCDYYSKYYKEKETYNGGVGDRLAFKNYNDKITKYQNILKVLTGERRANIYEAIPAIDFDDPKFTGFDYTYNVENDISTGQTTLTNDEIVPIPSSEGKTSMDLLEEEDKYTINRALMGETVAEHFYNTTGLSSSSYDLQVSPYVLKDGKYEYKYSGLLAPKTFKNGVYTDDIRISDLMYYPVTQATSMYFDEDTPRMVGVMENGYLVDVLQPEEDFGKNYRSTGNKVLNVDCGWTDVFDSNYDKVTGFKTGIIHADSVEFSGVSIIKNVENSNSVEYQYFGHYKLNLDAGDIIVAIPANSYTLSSTKLIIFKRNNTEGKEQADYPYTVAYFNSYNKRFYEDSEFKIAFNPTADENADKYILPIGNENINNVYKYSTLTTSYFHVENTTDVTNVVSINTTNKTVRLNKVKDPYTCYVLYIKGFNKDISSFSASSSYDPSAVFTKVSVGDDMPEKLMEDFIYSALEDYICVTCNFLSDASGLLTGFFSTPYAYSTLGDSNNVSKWNFVNERQTALSRGMDIDIGSKYFTGHLLNRGSIISSPLQLTTNDSLNGKSYSKLISEGEIQGKATLFLEKILSLGNIYDTIFRNYKVSDNNSFFRKYSITRVLTKEDFRNTNKLKYSKKFSKLTKDVAVSVEDITTYIDHCRSLFNGDTLNINLDSDLVKSSTGYTTYDSHLLWNSNKVNATTDPLYTMMDEVKNASIDKDNYLMAFYNIEKSWNKKFLWIDTGSGSDKWSKIYYSYYTPLDIFKSSSDDSKNVSSLLNGTYGDDVVLIFPEEKKYFPELVILMSNEQLPLEENNMCFLTKGEKLLGFKVSDVIEILPSRINRINVTKSGTSALTLEFKRTSSDDGGNVRILNEKNIEDTVEVYDEGFIEYAKTYSDATYKDYVKSGKRDCYIYYLTCITCEALQNQLEVYDAYNEKIDVSSVSSCSRFLPFSYAVNSSEALFQGTKQNEDSSNYTFLVNPKNREDYYKLTGYYIMNGVPNYTLSEKNGKDVCTIKSCSKMNYNPILFKNRYNYAKDFLNTFSSMIADADVYTPDVVINMMKDLISTWKLSTSSDNPILLRDLPQVFEGLIDLKNEMLDLSAEGVSIQSKGRTITINRADYEGLINLINEGVGNVGEGIRKYKFKVTAPSSIAGATIDKTNPQSECNKFMQSQLQNFSVELSNPNGTSWSDKTNAKYYTKASIKELEVMFDSIFFNNKKQQSLNEVRDTCKLLDRYFGNDTRAFLSIGESLTATGQRLDGGPSIETFKDTIVDSMKGVVTDVVTNVMKSSNSIDIAFENFKTGYKQYYTDASVESSITLNKDNTINTNWNTLIPRKEKKSLILDAYSRADKWATNVIDYFITRDL